ncbi:J domain-containing protein [uncultured Arthrobacter sp.]|uniref:J domain-containing protein n=1 Tax=uncultured Arthrobacter sp. TaxID=114050 RepID=UPI0032166055
MNRDPRGFYAALHVAPDATPAEIQRSFRALMRRRHPDVEASAGAGADGGEEVRRILESFAVLRNPDARAAYDAAGSAARQAGPADAGGTAAGTSAVGRDIPVRHHRGRQPVLRVTPVRWERGPE